MSTMTIGRYEIEEELGQGGMAVVYLARDPYMQRHVAVKVLSYQLTSDEIFLRYFQHEAEVIAALEHPCIVPVFDFGRHAHQPYIVMRYMAGGTLQDRLNDNGKIELSQLAHIIQRVADGLDAAHAQGIIHRDVKPSNILFDITGEAHLSDFGLAQSWRLSAEQTQDMFVGTPEYMSPEQVREDKLDGRSDIYALGAVIYCYLTGCPPYQEPNPMATALAHLNQPVPHILERAPGLPVTWQDIIAKAMAKDPDERYASAGEMAREVRELVSGRWYLRKLT